MERNSMMTLLEPDMALPCKELIDIYVSKPVDNVDLHDEVLLKYAFYKSANWNQTI